MRLRYFGILLILGLLVFLGCREWTRRPDGRTHVRFLDVGQGDAILIESPEGKRVLIDGGPDWSVLERLGQTLPFFDRRIDMVINTHPDLDHSGGLPSVFNRYRTGLLVLPPAMEASFFFSSLLQTAQVKKIPIRRITAGETIRIESGTTLSVLWPPENLPQTLLKNSNNHSLLLRLDSHGKRVLLTGDTEEPIERILTMARADLRADILKIGHHGSRSSSGTGFLLAIHPSLAVISVGENTFGHPRPEIMKRLEELGIPIRRTDREGTIDINW